MVINVHFDEKVRKINNKVTLSKDKYLVFEKNIYKISTKEYDFLLGILQVMMAIKFFRFFHQ